MSKILIAGALDFSRKEAAEFGLAQGLHKPHVVTAFKGTTLPFDVNDVPTIFWAGQTQLKEALSEKIGEIAAQQGRR